jgi:hypothetical protein
MQSKLRLDDLEIKPNLITKLKNAGIESIFDLAVSIPHDLNDNMLSGTDERIALDIVMKAKNALINAGLLVKDFGKHISKRNVRLWELASRWSDRMCCYRKR